jgi:hypothetical protein
MVDTERAGWPVLESSRKERKLSQSQWPNGPQLAVEPPRSPALPSSEYATKLGICLGQVGKQVVIA